MNIPKYTSETIIGVLLAALLTSLGWGGITLAETKKEAENNKKNIEDLTNTLGSINENITKILVGNEAIKGDIKGINQRLDTEMKNINKLLGLQEKSYKG